MRWFRPRKPRKPQKLNFLYGQPLGSIKTIKLRKALGRHDLPFKKLQEIQAELRVRIETKSLKPSGRPQFNNGKLYGQLIDQIATDKLENALGRFEVKSIEYKAISEELCRRSKGGEK